MNELSKNCDGFVVLRTILNNGFPYTSQEQGDFASRGKDELDYIPEKHRSSARDDKVLVGMRGAYKSLSEPELLLRRGRKSDWWRGTKLCTTGRLIRRPSIKLFPVMSTESRRVFRRDEWRHPPVLRIILNNGFLEFLP